MIYFFKALACSTSGLYSCQNGGTCLNNGICKCQPNYSGMYCEMGEKIFMIHDKLFN